jgi:hypothetical protein
MNSKTSFCIRKIMDNTPQTEQRSNKKLHAIYLTIIFILLGLSGLLFFKFKEVQTLAHNQDVTIKQVVVERNDVKSDLEDLQKQYAALETSDATLSKELEEKKALIAQLLVDAEKHKNDAGYIAKLKRETQTLREIMKGYIRTIDSLNILNGKLIDEKKTLQTTLDDEKVKSGKIEGDKNALKKRIDQASLLTTLNAKAVGISSRNGGKKESETSKAKKVDKIRVTFDVAENKLTQAGPKVFFIRVMTPDGKELTKSEDQDHLFSFNGSTGFYAAKKTIDYNNQPMSVLVSCPKAREEDEFLPGKYIIEINMEGTTIGSTVMTLE